ncbi:hypothetical protein C0584_05975 [Candidatus Parcubacteria bacterium]|nr:MAG: hypothetical protein C0584_05975 [Candidatus Parcubacteria bacterium]
MKKIILNSQDWLDEVSTLALDDCDKRCLEKMVECFLNRCHPPNFNYATMTRLEKILPQIYIDGEFMRFSVSTKDVRHCSMTFEQAKEWKDGFPVSMVWDGEYVYYLLKGSDGGVFMGFFCADSPGVFHWYSKDTKKQIPSDKIVGWKEIKEQ